MAVNPACRIGKTMRRILVWLLALTLVLPVALAHAESVQGIIQVIETETGVIVLDDGSQYIAPEGFDVQDLDVGMKVDLEFELRGQDNVIVELFVLE
jgi:hypothetical protein